MHTQIREFLDATLTHSLQYTSPVTRCRDNDAIRVNVHWKFCPIIPHLTQNLKNIAKTGHTIEVCTQIYKHYACDDDRMLWGQQFADVMKRHAIAKHIANVEKFSLTEAVELQKWMSLASEGEQLRTIMGLVALDRETCDKLLRTIAETWNSPTGNLYCNQMAELPEFRGVEISLHPSVRRVYKKIWLGT